MPDGLGDVVVHVAVAEVAERHGARAGADALDGGVGAGDELGDRWRSARTRRS